MQECHAKVYHWKDDVMGPLINKSTLERDQQREKHKQQVIVAVTLGLSRGCTTNRMGQRSWVHGFTPRSLRGERTDRRCTIHPHTSRFGCGCSSPWRKRRSQQTRRRSSSA